MIKIEKGVPVPKGRNRYRFAEMEVGDSFLIPPDVKATTGVSMAGAASRQYSPKRFVGRLMPEGRRIWRVA